MKTSLFEIIYNFMYHNIDDTLKDIKQVKGMSRKDFLLWQEKEKWKIVKYHYENNPFYRKLSGEPFPSNWAKLPIIQKSNLQGNLDGLISRPYRDKRVYVNKTSGSSGQPFNFVKDYYTQARVWAYKKLFFQMHGVDLGAKEAKFYRAEKEGKKRAVEIVKDFILNRHRFSVAEMNDESFSTWLNVFRNERFEYMYGYTSAIVLFSRYVIQQNIVLKDICPTIKTVIVTSETCTKKDKEVIKKATGLDARNEYGTADVGLIGYECQEGNIHLAEENIYVELDDNGELIITDLFNKAFPFIRYRLGDLAVISDKKCKCGENNKYLSEFQGRSNDMVILSDHRKVSGYAFYQELRPILEKQGTLKEFLIRQTAIGKIELDIISNEEYSQKILEEILECASIFLHESMDIKLNYMSAIDRPASGKLKHFYSDVD